MKSMVVTAKDDAFQQQYMRWIRAKTLQVLGHSAQLKARWSAGLRVDTCNVLY